MKRAWTVLIAATALTASAGCDSPGGSAAGFAYFDTSGQADVVDSDVADEDATVTEDTTATDTSGVVDEDTTQPPADTTQPPADTSQPPADTTQPADTTGTCNAAQCPATQQGPTGVDITLQPTTVSAPQLGGLIGDSPAPSGVFDLFAVDIFQAGTFEPSLGLELDITDNGGSNGTINFVGDMWSIYLGLDLHVTGSVFGTAFDDSANQAVALGGCWTVSGNEIVSDLSVCAESWDDSVDPPDSVGFEHDQAYDDLLIKLTLPQEVVISLLPEEYQAFGDAVVTGPLVLLAYLQAAQ